MAILARVNPERRTAPRVTVRFVIAITVLLLIGGIGGESVVAQRAVSRSVVFKIDDPIIRNRLTAAVAEPVREIERGEGVAADVADIAYTMEQILRGDGYAEARVDYAMFRISQAGTRVQVRTAARWPEVVRVEFTVVPGKKTYFGSFTFTGNARFSNEELREQIPIAATSAALNGESLPPITSVPYQAGRVRRFLRRIENKYVLDGYAEVVVGPATEQIRDDDTARYIDLTIPIVEGPRYTIEEVSVVAPNVPDDLTRSLPDGLGLIGKPFFPRQTAVGESTIRGVLGDAGYRPEISATTTRDNDGTVSIEYHVDAATRVILRDITVRSIDGEALRTRDRFVKRLSPFRRGDAISLSAVEQFENRLYDLGIFALVDITETVVGTESGTGTEAAAVTDDSAVETDEPANDTEAVTDVPTEITVSLRESRSRYVEVAAGWGSYELLRGRVNYTDNNVFGRALSWSTTGAVSFRTREISSSLTDQTLLGPHVRLTVDGAYGFRDAPSYDRTRTEGGLTGTYRITDALDADASYRYSYTVVDAVTAGIAGQEDDALRTGLLASGLTFDVRDSVLIPTRGQRLVGHVEWASAALGSEIDFYGVHVEGTTHHRITDGTIASLRGEYRTRVPFGGRTSLPIQERLFLGGSQSVRSFVQDRLGPGTEDGDPLGGLTRVLGSVEIRQRLFRELYFAAFTDVGAVGENAWETGERYGLGIGAGLRYHLPIGPLRLDAAYNPGETFTQERRWAVHFAIGFSF